MEPLVEKARDYCTKAVSLYQGLEQCTEQTLEWCDILVDVFEVARQRDRSHGSGVTEEQCDKVVAGVMAIKAFAPSNSGMIATDLL